MAEIKDDQELRGPATDTELKEVADTVMRNVVQQYPEEQVQKLQPKTKATRKAKAVVKSSGTVNQIIKGYEDRIALLLYAEGGSEPEVMGKEAKEIYLQYQKEKDQIKAKFIEKIQKL